MKIIRSMFFFVCLIQAIYSVSESGYAINFQENELSYGGCTVVNLYHFAMPATTSGFLDPYEFTFFLSKYIQVYCTVPPSVDGEVQLICCEIDNSVFPFFKGSQLIFPETFHLSDIEIKGWEYIPQKM